MTAQQPIWPTPLAVALALCVWLPSAVAGAQCVGGVCGLPVAPPSGGTIVPVVPAGPDAPAAMCRVVSKDRRGESLGSGALIGVSGDAGFVLTCAHLFDAGPQRIEIAFASQERRPATILAIDRANDLAVLRIVGPPVRPLPIEPTETPGGWLTCCGFGGGGRFRAVTGRAVGTATPIGATSASLRIRAAVRSGDSGGPVLDAAGRVVGVVWGVRQGVTYASFGAPLRRLLSRVSARVASRPASPSGPGAADLPRTPPRRLPITSPNADQQAVVVNDSRLAALESRLAELTPCRCPEDVVARGELSGFARTSDLGAFATRDELAESIGLLRSDAARSDDRFAAWRERAAERAKTAAAEAVRRRLAGADLKGFAWSKTQVLLASLGVGGPLGLALLAGRLFLRRRRSRRRRRGLGGPRPPGFRPA